MTDGELDGVIVTIDDIRKAGHCVSGARRWFAANNIPFAPFLRDGMPAAELVARGDGLALEVVTHKLDRQRGHG